MKTLSRDDLLSLAFVFISYLFRETTIHVQRIFLFGSVARGDFDEDSDIDLFIDTSKTFEQETSKKVERALKRFTLLEQKKWNLKGISNPLNVKVGVLKEWELQESVEKEGIVLYSPSVGSNLKKYFLFTLPALTPLKKRIKVIRMLFGRKEYQVPGLVLKYHGKILDPRCFLISREGLKEVSSFLAREKVNFAFEEIWK